MRLDLTLLQLGALKTMLADQFEEDERGYLDAIEGETDAFELVRKLLDRIETDEGDRAALTEQMDARKARRDRCDARIAAQREAIATVLKCAGINKLPLPEATISLRETDRKLAVNDPDAVPHEYAKQSWKPDMEAIKSAFAPGNDNLPNWLRVEPPKPSLTIRRK